eukprot:scaffold346_cov116-Cylindrotheca_fusiformis.AAC.5
MSHKQVRFSGIRSFSESAAASVKKGREDNSNIFLDNLGKIFLTTIAGIVGALIRSSYNTSNRNALRDALEEEAALDPVEIDELRIANSELTTDVFRSIVNDLRERFPDGNCSYVDFIKAVRRTMIQLKGEAFTIELGHQIDRVVAEVLLKFKKSDEEELPLSLWLVTLTLALNSSVADRLRILYELLQADSDPVRFHQIPILVGYLQDTCQLPPDTQLVPTDDKIPTQQWKKADPEELVPWEGSGDDIVDLDGFAAMLRSKSVCVWGECYQKKSFSSLHEKAK